MSDALPLSGREMHYDYSCSTMSSFSTYSRLRHIDFCSAPMSSFHFLQRTAVDRAMAAHSKRLVAAGIILDGHDCHRDYATYTAVSSRPR